MIYGINNAQLAKLLGRSPRPRWGSLQRSPIPPCWAGGGLTPSRTHPLRVRPLIIYSFAGPMLFTFRRPCTSHITEAPYHGGTYNVSQRHITQRHTHHTTEAHLTQRYIHHTATHKRHTSHIGTLHIEAHIIQRHTQARISQRDTHHTEAHTSQRHSLQRHTSHIGTYITHRHTSHRGTHHT